MKVRVLKWVLLLCAASAAVNGMLYGGTGNRDMLINLCGAIVIGIPTSVWLLVESRKR